MQVIPVPTLQDNYSCIIIDNKSNLAAFVDPVEPNKVLKVFDKLPSKPNLESIFTTHHHWDHASGNDQLVEQFPSLKGTVFKILEIKLVYVLHIVYGGDDERINKLNIKVSDQEVFNFGSLKVKCIHNPCHTRSSISYFLECGEDRAVFTGDTLFLGGCGR